MISSVLSDRININIRLTQCIDCLQNNKRIMIFDNYPGRSTYMAEYGLSIHC